MRNGGKSSLGAQRAARHHARANTMGLAPCTQWAARAPQLTTCRGARPRRTAAMNNVRWVQEVYDAFGRGDVARVLSAFDAALEWRQAEGHPYEPSGKAWIGPDAVHQKLFVRIPADWDGFVVHPKRFHDAGETV